MKHSEEWHTCDRCGEKIEKVPGELYPNMFFPRRTRIKLKKPISLEMLTAEREVYTITEIDSVVIKEYYMTKEKEIDLCPKCRKDFEKFMKNDR